jgi:hypothetical protein
LLATVGLNWQVGSFGNLSSLGETDMILRDNNSRGFQVYDVKNNQIRISLRRRGRLELAFSDVGNFSGRGTRIAPPLTVMMEPIKRP